MLPIYNKFFATPEIIRHKTCFGHLKACNDRHDLKCNFVNKLNDPCIVFFYAGNQIDEHVDNDLVNQVIDACKSNPKNILILDTIIEDYVNPPFMNCLDKILDSNILPEQIKIVTAFNPADKFIERFLEHKPKYNQIDVLCYNGFSTSFTLHQQGQRAELPEIGSRDVEKHFSLLQKNARFLRKLVHAFFIDNNYNQKSVYSWHNEGVESSWGEKEFIALERLGINTDLKKYQQPVLYDDIYENDEWSIPKEVLDNCAISLVVETSATRDDPNSLYSEYFHHRKNYFLSEKTYKNFWYGMPYIHLGMPFINERLNDEGYKTFRHLFEPPLYAIETNLDGFKNDMALIDSIANKSIDEIMNTLNDPQIFRELGHNRKMLSRLLPLKNLVTQLDKY